MDDDLGERLAALVDTTDADALADLGCDLAAVDRFVEAEACFRRAIAMGAEDVWFNLGHTLREQERLDEAVDAYQTATELGDWRASLNLGLLLEDIGDHDAEAHAAFALAHERGDPNGAHALSNLLHRQGDKDGSLIWLRKAAEVSDLAAGDLAVTLKDAGTDEDLEPLLRRGAPVDENARADLGQLLWHTDRIPEAVALLSEGAAKNETGAMIVLANLYEELGYLQGAEQVLRRAIELGERHALNNLGTLLRDQGHLIEAQQLFAMGSEQEDDLAANNLARLRKHYRRQLNRAHRRTCRRRLPGGS